MTADKQLCSICTNPTLNCYGCMVEPDSRLPLYEILKDSSFFAIDWNIDFLNQYYQPQSLRPIEYENLKESQSQQSGKVVQLTDCLKIFSSTEQIHVREGIMCERCLKPTHHVRRIGVSRAPPVLVIHLKRFKIINK